MALHRAWQAVAERLHGELQRQADGRVFERACVLTAYPVHLSVVIFNHLASGTPIA